MVYINASKGGVIAFFVFLIATYIIPTGFNIEGIDIILTISTFLFAIYSGFFMSRLNDRYEDIEGYYTSEDAKLLSFSRDSLSISKKLGNKVKEILDEYYILVFDLYDTERYYKGTAKAFVRLYDMLSTVNKKKLTEEPFDDMYVLLSEIEENRNKAAEELSKEISKGQWASLIVLGSTIIVSIFLLRTDAIIFLILSALFSSVVIIILLTMRDLENLKLGGHSIAQESAHDNLDFMGLLRYYNAERLNKEDWKIPSNIKEYRLGMHKPGAEKFKIKVVKNQRYKKK
tara:strand:+ start:1337 stop:2197 length:861 start_codon:yes stop_codon:yes gene_type:complete